MTSQYPRKEGIFIFLAGENHASILGKRWRANSTLIAEFFACNCGLSELVYWYGVLAGQVIGVGLI